jgi:hypothetical protein
MGGDTMRKFLPILFLLIASAVLAGDYVLIVYSEPLSQVFVNGNYVGTVDVTGQMILTLNSSGKFTITVRKSWYIPFESEIIVSSPGEFVIFANLKEAGALRVFSNVYPVEVFAEGMYLGKIHSVKDVLYVPAGTVTLTFKAPGYKEEAVTVQVKPRSENTINIYLEEKALALDLKVEPERFSPNGDWYNDKTTFYIYLSKPADLSVEVLNDRGETIWFRQLKGSEGTNKVIWDGKDASDGRYRVRVTASTDDEMQSVEKEVIVDRSEYTYFKELFIGSVLALVVLLILVH